jgi:membrane-associated phospholipid phosphatase
METWLKDPFFFGEDIVNSLHIFAGSWLDLFMATVTQLGNQMFYVIILPIAYWTWEKKTTLKIGAVFLISAVFNDSFKELYGNPRPDPARLLDGIRELNLAYIPHNSPGFPSGHTQGAVTFWGSVFLYIKSNPVRAIALILILLIPYSRIYLGVHFLGDVTGGFVIGAVLLALIIPLNGAAERRWQDINGMAIIITITALPLLLLLILPGRNLYQPLGVISSMVCGAYMAHDRIAFSPKNGPGAAAVKVILGLTVVILLKAGLKPLLPVNALGGYFRYWLIGFWVSFGAPLLFSCFEFLRGEESV